MNFLDRIAAKLAVLASAALTVAVEEGKEFVEKVADAAVDGFEDLVDKLGDAATKFVTDLFADDTLKGIEKANLAAVQLTEHAALNGIAIAEQDVTALVKSAYLAVKAEIAKL